MKRLEFPFMRGVVFTGIEEAAIVAAVASAAAGAYGAYSSGQAQSAGLKYNAEIQRTNAANAQSQAQAQAAIAGRDAERQRAQAAASFAAGGVDVGAGSPLDVLNDVTKEGELNRQLVLYRGKVAADNSTAQAGLDTAQASSASTAGELGAGATLLGGLARTYTTFNPPAPRPAS